MHWRKKRFISITLVFFIFFSGILPHLHLYNILFAEVAAAESPGVNPVNIPDEHLRDAIRRQLELEPGADITGTDMEKLRFLNTSDYREIADLTGIEAALNLKIILIGDNKVTNIEPLSELDNLWNLTIWDTPIEDFTPLQRWENLEFLFLEYCNLHNSDLELISETAFFENLILLNIGGNMITDSTPLEKLQSMAYLTLNDNRIDDISFLAGLEFIRVNPEEIIDKFAATGMEIREETEYFLEHNILDLSQNKIVDINDLNKLVSIENIDILNLSDNLIDDISPLAAWTHLKKLNLDNNEIDTAEGSDTMNMINALIAEGVEVSYKKTVDIPDENLRNAIIRELELTGASDITQAEMRLLKELNVSKSEINNLTGLEHASNLEWLNINDNEIYSLVPLQGLKNLTFLDVSNNSVNSYTPVWGLDSLRAVLMSDCGLNNSDIESLGSASFIGNLVVLELENNQITDIAPLTGLEKLFYLNLSGNQIESIEALQNIEILSFDELMDIEMVPEEERAPIKTSFNLSRNLINDLTPLETVDLSKVRLLNLSRNKIEDISSLATLSELIFLDLSHNEIVNISPLKGLQIKDGGPIPSEGNNYYKNFLDLSYNKIFDLQPLENLRFDINKEYSSGIFIDISHNQIEGEGLAPLADAEISILQELYLSDNEITDIAGVEGLVSLKILDLSRNLINDISPLGEHNELTHLNLRDNNLKLIPGEGSMKVIEALEERGTIVDYGQVFFVDANLQIVIRDTLELSENQVITEEIMKSLLTLDAGGLHISRIDGLEYAENLKELNLSGSHMTNINIVAGLQNLEALNLSGVMVTDFTLISELHKLKKLNLKGNGITDIEFITKLVNLEELDLSQNDLNAINNISSLTNLRELYLSQNQMDSIFDLADLSKLEILDLSHNQIAEIAPIYLLINLQRLNLSYNRITYLSSLEGKQNLEELDLSFNSIREISPIKHLTGLKNLNLIDNDFIFKEGTPCGDIISKLTEAGVEVLYGNQVDIPDAHLQERLFESLGKDSEEILTDLDMSKLISFHAPGREVIDLSGLEYAVNLEELSINSTKIVNLELIAALKKLKILSIINSGISEIAFLSELTLLHTLYLSDNQIVDITPLSGLTGLRELNLNNNDIEDISPLAELVRINILELKNNAIKEIGALSGFNNLKKLSLGNNKISDISPLAEADPKPYWELYLNNNRVTDISPLKELENLYFLVLSGNHIIDISPISSLFRLQFLELADNMVEDISPLKELASTEVSDLRVIDLNNNRISDILPLSGFTYVRAISITHNNIDIRPDSPQKEIINVLEASEVDIVYEPQIKKYFQTAMNPETGEYEAGMDFENAKTVLELSSKTEVSGSVFVNRYKTHPLPFPEANLAPGFYIYTDISPETAVSAITLKINYDPSEIPDGIDEEELNLYFYDEVNQSWRLVPVQELSAIENHISAEVTETGLFFFGVILHEVLPAIKYGYVLGGTSITVADAIAVLRHIVGLQTLKEEALQRAKVTKGVGDVSVSDAITILRYIVGLIQQFPAAV